jgi:hypothetical protein
MEEPSYKRRKPTPIVIEDNNIPIKPKRKFRFTQRQSCYFFVFAISFSFGISCGFIVSQIFMKLLFNCG